MSFEKQLKFVLKHIKDPARLTAESPLATPFFLSSVLSHIDEAAEWGNVLRQVMIESIDALHDGSAPASREALEIALPAILAVPDGAPYRWLVLEMRYLQRYYRPRSLQAVFSDFLGTSRSQFYRDVDEAVKQLSALLLRRVQPLLRLLPPDVPPNMVGYEGQVARINTLLQSGSSVALEGVSGIGKSTLGARVAAAWDGAVFWFTVRAQINDGATTLLYALSYFCRQHGQTRLWKLLMLNEGRVGEWGLALGLLREDIEGLAHTASLFCFDEADVWQLRASGQLAQTGQLVAALQSVAPVLLIGQTVTLPTDERLLINGLDVSESTLLLKSAEISFPQSDIARLHRQTQGNPRLLWLIITLVKQGDSLDTLLAETNRLRGYLWQLWSRLTPTERGLLQLLSVFPTIAPADAFTAESVMQLQQKHLVEVDGQGGVSLLKLVGELIYEQLSAEQREQLHANAAAIHAERGAYTEAAWHLAQGNRPKEAIQLWFPHRQQELASGAITTARSIFSNISLNQLKQREANALGIIRAELSRMEGAARDGLATLDAVVWPLSHELTLDAKQLRGDFLDALGYPDAALRTWDDGITQATRTLAQLGALRVRQGALQGRQRRMDDAWRTAQLARYEAEHLQGFVADERGHSVLAEQHYRAALATAEQFDHPSGIARTHRFMSRLFGRMKQTEKAVDHSKKAITFYEQVGDQLNVAATRSNLTALYLDSGAYDKVIEIGKATLAFLIEVEHTHVAAATASNLAEASYHLGDLEAASYYVQVAMRQEEPLAMPYALYTQALIEQKRGALVSAETTIKTCLKIAEQNDDSHMAAYARDLLATIVKP